MNDKVFNLIRLLTIYVFAISFIGFVVFKEPFLDDSLGIFTIPAYLAVAFTFAVVSTGIFTFVFFIIFGVAEVLGFGEILFKIANFSINLPELIKCIKKYQTKKSNLIALKRYKLLEVTEKLFSEKDQKEIFEQAIRDWDSEVIAAEKNKEMDKLNFIHARHLFHFLGAIWQKSPIGDLIEFVIKIAKP